MTTSVLPDAFRHLMGAADAIPAADYLGFYALVAGSPPEGGHAPVWLSVPRRQRTATPLLVDGSWWRLAVATTSTFGARVAAVRRDRRAFVASMATATATAWDSTASLTYQGYQPFPWRQLAGDFRFGEPSVTRRVGALGAMPGRIVVNMLALRRRHRDPLLWAADPALCTHLKSAHLALGTDSAAVAAETASWAQHRAIGLGVA